MNAKLAKSVAAILAVALASSAQAVDITLATAELTEGQTNVVSIGGAVLVIAVTIAVFKYVKKAF